MDCIFCQIVKREIPSAIIWEDDNIFCFLDINPLTRGHTLIIPKEHYENVFDIEANLFQELMAKAQKIALVVKRVLKADGVNLLNASGAVAEQSVPHFHLHIVPRYLNDGLDMSQWWQTKTNKAEFAELQNLAQEIKDKI